MSAGPVPLSARINVGRQKCGLCASPARPPLSHAGVVVAAAGEAEAECVKYRRAWHVPVLCLHFLPCSGQDWLHAIWAMSSVIKAALIPSLSLGLSRAWMLLLCLTTRVWNGVKRDPAHLWLTAIAQ